MTTSERNFSNYQLGDNVYELAGGVIPEMAGRLGMELGSEPSSELLGHLVGSVGKNKVLRDNEEVTAINREDMVRMVEQAGVQQSLSRSLWAPDIHVHKDTVDAIVLNGGVANWQDRGANLVAHGIEKPVYVVAGNRIMNTGTEVTNPNVARLHEAFGRYPKESEYAASVILPTLVSAGKQVLSSGYETGSGSEIAQRFFEDNPHLLEERLVFARVANAGIQLAVQMRKAAQTINPEFDADPNNPQVFVITDSFPLARTEEQEAQPSRYQKAATALRQVAVTAKMLHEAAGGQ